MLTVLIIVIASLVAAGLLYLFLIAPGRRADMSAFVTWHYAHRGLHTRTKTVPENSTAAFRRAIKNGYGIELDIRLSKDKKVVVFHDENLERVCGDSGKVADYTFEALKAFRLHDTNYQIPTFQKVLRLIDGQVPLIIEIKTGKQNAALCRAAMRILEGYTGDYCIESFDPRIVRWFKRNHPQIVRGILATKTPDNFGYGWPVRFALTHLLTNFYCRPQFVAYDIHQNRNLGFWLCRKLFHAFTVGWTIRKHVQAEEQIQINDLLIFEGIRLPTDHVPPPEAEAEKADPGQPAG